MPVPTTASTTGPDLPENTTTEASSRQELPLIPLARPLHILEPPRVPLHSRQGGSPGTAASHWAWLGNRQRVDPGTPRQITAWVARARGSCLLPHRHAWRLTVACPLHLESCTVAESQRESKNTSLPRSPRFGLPQPLRPSPSAVHKEELPREEDDAPQRWNAGRRLRRGVAPSGRSGRSIRAVQCPGHIVRRVVAEVLPRPIVSLRGPWVSMARSILHSPKRRPGLQRNRDERMPQRVRTDGGRHLGRKRRIRKSHVVQLTRDLRRLLLRADRPKIKVFLSSILDSVVVGTDSVEVNYSFPVDDGNGKAPKAQDILAWRQRREWDSNPRDACAPTRFRVVRHRPARPSLRPRV